MPTTLNISADTSLWSTLWAIEPNSLNRMATGAKAATDDTSKPSQQYAVVNSTAIIPIVGAISKYPSLLQKVSGGISTLAIQNDIAKALNDPSIDRIILFIDSPGGTVAGTADLADFIAASKLIKPITAYVSDHCFSAAYWIAAQCTSIIANEGAFVGSIGVYSVLVDTSEAAAKAGISVYVVRAGELKGVDTEGVAISDVAVAEVQRIVNASCNLFINSVARGRNLSSDIAKQLADGRIHVAAEAQQLKLIDAIGTLDSALTFDEGTQNMDNKDAKAADAPATPATPDIAEVLKQIQASIAALTEQVKQLLDSDDDDDSTDDGTPDQADDDSGDATAKAVAADRDRLKAINDACKGRAEFAIASFLSGKSAIETKAALADVLETENNKLRKAASADGIEPIATGSPVDETDPETMWARNINDIQKSFSGKKEYFLASLKHQKAQSMRGTK